MLCTINRKIMALVQKISKQNSFILLIVFAWFPFWAFATSKQDTLKINLANAEKTFMDSNLQIIAQKLNVDATRALIIQAKLYPNPNFNFTQAAYHPETNKWFELGADAEEAYQVSQLIVLSHKIKKQVHIAESNYKLAEDNLYDLLRTLKYGLRSTFYNIYYLQQTAKVYQEEIDALKKVVAAYKEVQGKGYVAESEIVQVQAQLYSLQSEYQGVIDNINDQESQFRLFLQTKPNFYYIPEVNNTLMDQDVTTVSIKTLLDSAEAHRTDLMIARDNLLLAHQNYTLQKALAVPDLTVGLNLDRHGSYYTDFNSLSLGIDIPIFNRNQGNIKNARILVDYNKADLELTEKTTDEQVARGLQKAIDADRLYKEMDTGFSHHFDRLAKEMLDNYMKRNVNLLTFLTFYDSYKQNVVQFNTILNNKVAALESLNYLTGTDFYNK